MAGASRSRSGRGAAGIPELIWTPAALRDVQRCYRFLLPKKPVAASRAVTAIREEMRIIEVHPEAGRPAAKMDTEFREWLMGFGDSGYVVLYRLDEARAVVLAVRHPGEAGYG